jgi:tRNA (cytidine32/uridine32-2'-O)-methyltransferase
MNAETSTPLDRIRFILVETTHTGNIGAVARAMKTMGLTQLNLVRPKRRPDAEAVARACGADDLLAACQVHDDLVESLQGTRLVIGSSARRRSLEWPLLEPAACAELLLGEAAQGDVALLLGRESSGLTNDELAHCHYLVHIPTNPAFSSLNLAAAAQVFAYEIWRARLAHRGEESAVDGPREVATAEALDGFHQHLARTLVDIGFADPEQSRKLGRRLRRLFNRARPDWTELNILRGILSAAQGRKTADRFRKRALSSSTMVGSDAMRQDGCGELSGAEQADD